MNREAAAEALADALLAPWTETPLFDAHRQDALKDAARALAAIERGDIPGVTLAACGCAHDVEDQRYCRTCVTLGADTAARVSASRAADREPDVLRAKAADLGREQERNGRLLAELDALRDQWATLNSDLAHYALYRRLCALLAHPATDQEADQ